MPKVEVVFFQENEGKIPLLEWFDELPDKALAKCRARIERLKSLGHEIRRPEADYLRDGIYELRVGLNGINYRMLYFFYGNKAVVISHGVIKEKAVPLQEIDRAIKCKRKFEQAPDKHTYQET